eukprot:scaffold184524_cov34-Tisochrysis_lutea.AAC.1
MRSRQVACIRLRMMLGRHGQMLRKEQHGLPPAMCLVPEWSRLVTTTCAGLRRPKSRIPVADLQERLRVPTLLEREASPRTGHRCRNGSRLQLQTRGAGQSHPARTTSEGEIPPTGREIPLLPIAAHIPLSRLARGRGREGVASRLLPRIRYCDGSDGHSGETSSAVSLLLAELPPQRQLDKGAAGEGGSATAAGRIAGGGVEGEPVSKWSKACRVAPAGSLPVPKWSLRSAAIRNVVIAAVQSGARLTASSWCARHCRLRSSDACSARARARASARSAAAVAVSDRWAAAARRAAETWCGCIGC